MMAEISVFSVSFVILTAMRHCTIDRQYECNTGRYSKAAEELTQNRK